MKKLRLYRWTVLGGNRTPTEAEWRAYGAARDWQVECLNCLDPIGEPYCSKECASV